MFLGTWQIDDQLTFTVNTHSPTTGAEADADAAPTYRVYEDETGTAILNGSMALLDDANTVGHYSEQIALSAANGFEVGKTYSIRIRGVVSAIAGACVRQFQVEAAVATQASVDTLAGYVDTEVGAIKAKTDNLPSDPADQSAVEAAITSATSPLATAANLATVAGYIDTEIASILSDLATLLSRISATRAGYLDNLSAGAVALQGSVDDLEGRLTAPRAAALDNLDATVSSRASQTSVNTIDDLLDTEMAALQTDLTTVLARLTSARASYLDQLNTAMELDGAVYRFTANALEQGPTGSGFTEDDRTTLEDIEAIVTTIGDGEVTIVAPVSATGDVTIVRGDDYYHADGRALSFTPSGAPNLTGATVHLHIYRAGKLHTVVGTAVSATQVRFELPRTLTSKLAVPTSADYYDFTIEAALVTSAREVTIHKGKMYVTESEP